jgi:pimeloyl-ACP methyl ester carboxylesterase
LYSTPVQHTEGNYYAIIIFPCQVTGVTPPLRFHILYALNTFVFMFEYGIIPDYFNEFRSARAVVRNEGLEKGKEAWLNIQPLRTAAQNPKSSELLKAMIKDYSGWHWLNKNPHKKNPKCTIELMSQIKNPTLIIAGELSHPVMKDVVNAQEKYISNSKKVILNNSNHMLNIENPEQFNKELDAFLKQHMIE